MAHLAADRRADILCRDRGRIHLELICKRLIQFFTLIQIQSNGLDDHLIGTSHLLCLYVVIAGHILSHRNDLFINLIDGVISVKFYGSGGSSLKLQSVGKKSLSLRLVKAHHRKSDHHHCNRQGEEIFLSSQEVEFLSLFFRMIVERFLLKPQCIEGKNNQSGNYKRCKHGHNDTDRKSLCKSLDCTGASEPEYCRGDQSGHIAVHNGRHGFLESCLQRILHALAPGHLFPDTGKDDNIGIHRHTDT